MAKSSTVKLAIVSTYDDKGSKKAYAALNGFEKNVNVAGSAVASEFAAASIEAQQSADQLAQKWESAGARLTSTGKVMTAGITVPLAAITAASVSAAVETESSFAGVRKTVDATEEEYQGLLAAARELSTTQPVDVNTLNDIMALGGQLDIAKENLVGFAEVVSGLDIATNLDSEQAATELAQFANITNMAEGNMSNYASTLVALGNNSATTESEISAMAQRIAAAGTQIGMSEANILALSATMASLGINAEAGGTAISTIMAEVDKSVGLNSENLKTWAATAGMSVEDFKTAWETDATGALVSLISGMEAAVDEGGNMSVMLDELGISSIRQTDVLKRMANNSDLLTDSLGLANTAWSENTALQTEVDAKNATTEAQLQTLKNKVYDVGVELGSSLLPAFNELVDAGVPVIDALKLIATSFTNMDEESQKVVITTLAVVAAAGPVLTVSGKLSTKVGGLVRSYGAYNARLIATKAALIAETAATGKSTTAKVKALSAVQALSKATAVAGGLLTSAMVVGFAMSAASAIKNAEATKESTAALQATIESAKSFGTILSETSAQVGDLSSYVSASGRTISELDSVISQAEAGITSVIQGALSEQRALRDEDIQAINEYNDQIKIALQEKSDTYVSALEGQYAAVSSIEDELSTEQAAQYISNITAISDEAVAALEEGHNTEIAAIQRKYEAMGQVGSEAYNEEIKAQNDFYQTQLDTINTQGDKATVAVTEKQSQITSAAVKEWQSLGKEVSSLNDQAHAFGIEWLDTFNVALADMTGGFDEAKNKYRTALSEIDVEQTTAFLGMVGTAKASGAELSDEHKAVALSILSAYDNLPDALDETGKESLLSLISGMESELTGATDLSGKTADEIVEMMRSHLNLGDLGADEMAAFARGMASEEPTVISTSDIMVANALNPLNKSGLFYSNGSANSNAFASGIGAAEAAVRASADRVSAAAAEMQNVGDPYTWGYHVSENFAAGISAGQGVVSAASSAVASATAAVLKHSKPKEGPLSEGEELWGEHAGENFATGLLSSTKTVSSAAFEIADSAARGLQQKDEFLLTRRTPDETRFGGSRYETRDSSASDSKQLPPYIKDESALIESKLDEVISLLKSALGLRWTVSLDGKTFAGEMYPYIDAQLERDRMKAGGL